MNNKYSKKIEKLYNDYTKQFKRKDETFAMGTIKALVKEIETEDYMEHTEEEVEIIAKYLCEKYFARMSERKDKLIEQAKQEGWHY